MIVHLPLPVCAPGAVRPVSRPVRIPADTVPQCPPRAVCSSARRPLGRPRSAVDGWTQYSTEQTTAFTLATWIELRSVAGAE